MCKFAQNRYRKCVELHIFGTSNILTGMLMRQTEERYISLLTDFGFLDKWLFVLRNLPRLDNQPERLRSELFNRLFEEAEIARFTKTELREYEDSLKAYRDIKNSLDTAEEKGRAEGRAEGLTDVAKAMLAKGMDNAVIAELTGLPMDTVVRLSSE